MTHTSGTLAWKPDWPQAKANWIRFWNRQGMVIALHPRRQTPVEPLPEPPPPVSLEQRWLDPAYRAARTEYDMATHAFLAEGMPIFDTFIGPGSLGLFLGAGGHLDETTVWYSPCIDDPDAYGPIRFEPAGNVWFERHMALIETGLRAGERAVSGRHPRSDRGPRHAGRVARGYGAALRPEGASRLGA